MLLENQFNTLGTMIQDRMGEAFGDLSPRAAAVLLTLLNRGSLTVSVLAGIVGVSQPTATRLIGGLETRSFIRRSVRDGRSVWVSLTQSGIERAESLQIIRTQRVRSMIQPLNDKECATLAQLIDKILYAMTDSRAAARTVCRYCDHGACEGEDCPVNRRATRIEEQARA